MADNDGDDLYSDLYSSTDVKKSATATKGKSGGDVVAGGATPAPADGQEAVDAAEYAAALKDDGEGGRDASKPAAAPAPSGAYSFGGIANSYQQQQQQQGGQNYGGGGGGGAYNSYSSHSSAYEGGKALGGGSQSSVMTDGERIRSSADQQEEG